MGAKSNIYRQRRSKRKKQLTVLQQLATFFAVAVIAIVCGIAATTHKDNKAVNPDSGLDLTAVKIPDDTREYIKDYTGFRVSFNPEHHQPNYVVWELTAGELDGTQARTSKFNTDAEVPGCASTNDYKKSGYDRGHMAPAGDMKWSYRAMTDSHYMTNICPQSHDLNGGRWATLENKCREWARRDSAIIIIAGPVLSDRLDRKIGDIGVTVPDRFFKVLLSPYVNPPRGIAFIMPNNPPFDGIEDYATTIDNVEAITGFDFFSSLPDDIETAVESQAKYRDWDRRNR